MTPAIDTKDRTDDLVRELAEARRQVSIVDQEESNLWSREQEEKRRWIDGKTSKFLPVLEQFLRAFPRIQEMDDSWRERVFRGQEEFDQATETRIFSLYAMWSACSLRFQERAEFLVRHDGDCRSELNSLRKYQHEANRLIRNWESPVLSRAPSFRPQPLSAEASARLRALFPDVT